MNIKRKNSLLAESVIITYGIIETFKYVQIISVWTANIIGCLIGGLSIFYVAVKHGISKQGKIIVFLYIYEGFGLISCLYNSNMDFQELLWFVFFMGIALLLLNENISNIAAAFPVFFFCTVLLLYLSRVGKIYELNISESRNYSSVYLLSFYSIYLIVRHKNGENTIPWAALLLSTIVAYLSLGRGGILTFSFVVILSLYYSIKTKKRWRIIRKQDFFVKLVVIMFLLGVCVFSKDIINLLMRGLDRSIAFFIDRGMKSSSRIEMWKDYFKQIILSPIHLLVAPPIAGTELLSQFSTNLHNSFFMLYARYGLFVFCIVMYKIYRSILWQIRNKYWILCIVFLGILVRCFTDSIGFNGVMDISLYYMMFAPSYPTD